MEILQILAFSVALAHFLDELDIQTFAIKFALFVIGLRYSNSNVMQQINKQTTTTKTIHTYLHNDILIIHSYFAISCSQAFVCGELH